jgi:hypothetical protein
MIYVDSSAITSIGGRVGSAEPQGHGGVISISAGDIGAANRTRSEAAGVANQRLGTQRTLGGALGGATPVPRPGPRPAITPLWPPLVGYLKPNPSRHQTPIAIVRYHDPIWISERWPTPRTGLPISHPGMER